MDYLAVAKANSFVQSLRAQIQHRFLTKALIALYGFHNAKSDLSTGWCAACSKPEISIRNLRWLSDGNGIVFEVLKRHCSVMSSQRCNGRVRNGARVERISPVL